MVSIRLFFFFCRFESVHSLARAVALSHGEGKRGEKKRSAADRSRFFAEVCVLLATATAAR